jgi:hypothetical protein
MVTTAAAERQTQDRDGRLNRKTLVRESEQGMRHWDGVHPVEQFTPTEPQCAVSCVENMVQQGKVGTRRKIGERTTDCREREQHAGSAERRRQAQILSRLVESGGDHERDARASGQEKRSP